MRPKWTISTMMVRELNDIIANETKCALNIVLWGSLEVMAVFFMQTAINCVFVVYQMMEYRTSLRMVDFEREKLTNHSWSKSKSALELSQTSWSLGQTSCLAELSLIEMRWKHLYQSLFKNLYLWYCTGKIQMTMTSKKEIAKCPGKA